MIRTVVIFIIYGPYHLEWARSLAEIEGIEPCFIRLASELERYHPWKIDEVGGELDLRTLSQRSYEQTPFRELRGKLMRELDELRPQAVVVPSYSPPIMLEAARWAKRNGAASIMMNDTTEADQPRVWWKEKVKRFIVRRYYDSAFVGGTATREYLFKLGMPRERIWEGYDVVDNDYFRRATEQVLQTEEECRERAAVPRRYFLYVGRLLPGKNLVRLLEAYRLYKEREPDGWGLVLVGDGPQRGELEEAEQSLGLDAVLWPGFRQIDELPTYYALAGAFILPSTSETWGLVVNEAMASGLPVLVSNYCGSSRNLVSEGVNGYTFNPYSVQEMADRMSQISGKDEVERAAMSEASRQIIADYTPERWGERLASCVRHTVELDFPKGAE